MLMGELKFEGISLMQLLLFYTTLFMGKKKPKRLLTEII